MNVVFSLVYYSVMAMVARVLSEECVKRYFQIHTRENKAHS
jgi:hypothetical protein